jgi:protein-S-isoprenylcysteine O-methyltransferase Ste14
MIGPMAERPDNPGVRVPPPALYAFAVLVGYVLNRRWPLRIGGGATVQALSWILSAASVALMVSGIGNFRRWGTSIVPIQPATTLVTSGPYRFTRNPMYLGLAVLTVAFGLFMGSWWPVVLLLPVLLVVRVLVIGPEEQYLERRFGGEYVGYKRRVRRWL